MSFMSLVTLVVGIAIGEAASLLRQSQQAFSCIPAMLVVEVETLVFIFGPSPSPSPSLSLGPSATVTALALAPAHCLDFAVVIALLASALSAVITAGLFMRFAKAPMAKFGTMTPDDESSSGDLLVTIASDRAGDACGCQDMSKASVLGLAISELPLRLALPLSPISDDCPVLPSPLSPTLLATPRAPSPEPAFGIALSELPLRLALPLSPISGESPVLPAPLSPAPLALSRVPMPKSGRPSAVELHAMVNRRIARDLRVQVLRNEVLVVEKEVMETQVRLVEHTKWDLRRQVASLKAQLKEAQAIILSLDPVLLAPAKDDVAADKGTAGPVSVPEQPRLAEQVSPDVAQAPVEVLSAEASAGPEADQGEGKVTERTQGKRKVRTKNRS